MMINGCQLKRHGCSVAKTTLPFVLAIACGFALGVHAPALAAPLTEWCKKCDITMPKAPACPISPLPDGTYCSPLQDPCFNQPHCAVSVSKTSAGTCRSHGARWYNWCTHVTCPTGTCSGGPDTCACSPNLGCDS